GPAALGRARDRVAALAGRLHAPRAASTGTRPMAYLAPKSREALGDRLGRLGVNSPRLTVEALAERMTLSGMSAGSSSSPWPEFVNANGPELAELVHTDRLLYGSAYVTVWATEQGTPTLTGDSPFTMTHGADPATGETLWAARR